eukprot:1149915-Pelagomonas_calceolata.AAC.5
MQNTGKRARQALEGSSLPDLGSLMASPPEAYTSALGVGKGHGECLGGIIYQADAWNKLWRHLPGFSRRAWKAARTAAATAGAGAAG